MGSAEIYTNELLIRSHIITYGSAATELLTKQMQEEIETMWNETEAVLFFNGEERMIRFKITSAFRPDIQPYEIFQNLDPRNNYFRIEEFAHGNISFVDGLGCNSGYFKLENLYAGSSTAAHEYGHTLGLDHPENLDLRGKGVPGIMYPRGTLVDPEFQYDPTVPAGIKGGTLHPVYRKVLVTDIQQLHLHSLVFNNNKAVIGEFTNVWHDDHAGFNS